MKPFVRPSLMLCSTLFWALFWAPGAALAGPADDARVADGRGDYDAAVAAWRRAVEADPAAISAREQLGRALLRAKDPQGAVVVFRALIERHPEYTRGRYRLAFALRKAGKLQAASVAYRRYLKETPEDPDGVFGLAETLRRLGDGVGALAAYQRYVRLERRPSEARWVKRAQAEIRRLDGASLTRPGAERDLDTKPTPRATASGPNDPDADFEAGRFLAAKTGYGAAVAANPSAPALRYRWSVAAALSGDLETAERAAASVVRLDPGNESAEALALAARARRRPKMLPPDLAIAQLALKEGRYRSAARLASEALKTEPSPSDRAALLRVRGRALVVLGRGAEALRVLKAAAGVRLDAGFVQELAAAVRQSGDTQTATRFEAWARRMGASPRR